MAGEDAKSCDYPESQTQHKRMYPPSPSGDYLQCWWRPARCAAAGERASPSPGVGGRQGLSGRFLGLSSCPISPAPKFLDPRLLAPAGFGAYLRTVLPCAVSPAFLASAFLASSQALSCLRTFTKAVHLDRMLFPLPFPWKL